MSPMGLLLFIAGVVVGVFAGLLLAILRAKPQQLRDAAQLALLEQDRNFQLNRVEQLQRDNELVNGQLSASQACVSDYLQQIAKASETIQNTSVQLADKNAFIARLELQSQDLQRRLELAITENASLVSAQLTRDLQYEKQMAQLDQQKHMLMQEFQNIANRIFEEKNQSFANSSQQSLEQLLKPFRDQMSEFRQRVDTIHKENNEAASSLRTQLGYLKELNQQMTSDAQNLTRALKGDKKLSGGWGEVQLEKSLQSAGLLEGEHYQREAVFDSLEGGNRRPDFILKLPDDKHVVLDSKVSLVDYDLALSVDTEALQQQALDAHVKAVKKHIDQLALRDYTNLIGMRSPNFVLMFMPVEPAYIEALKHGKDLFNYGFEKNVVLVSHTTLMPILRTVANLWMIERGNREAREISARAGEIYNHLALVAERLLKLGKALGTANSHYNDTVRGMVGNQGLYGKVERFKDLANNITRQLPAMEPQYQDVEFGKLEMALGLNLNAEISESSK